MTISKNVLMLIAAVILCMGLTACGGGGSTISDYCDALEKGRQKMFEGKLTNGELKKDIDEQFKGKQQTMEVDDLVGFEIVEPCKVASLSPLYGDIQFDVVVKQADIEAGAIQVGDFVFVACNGSEPVKVMTFDNTSIVGDGSFKIRCGLNVGNIVQGGEKADEAIRSIDRIVITGRGCPLFQKINQ